MPRRIYTPHRFGPEAQAVIRQAEAICRDYASQGYDLTLRQLYYQFVARDLVPNTDRSYKRLGAIVNDARLAGLLDWHYIVDRTRYVRSLSHWDSPADIIQSAARSFAIDKWEGQDERVEVWIEKDALVGVIENVCERNDVPYFACRGYTSQSEVWSAAQRIGEHLQAGAEVTILHLGDHDPSGIDMTRDIADRVKLFLDGDQQHAEGDWWPEAFANEWDLESADPDDWTAEQRAEFRGWLDLNVELWSDRFEVRRLGLNYDQVQQYQPPPNPAKLTDSRAGGYVARFGRQSWELDALEPAVIVALIQDAIDGLRDARTWNERVAHEAAERVTLTTAAERWAEVATMLGGES